LILCLDTYSHRIKIPSKAGQKKNQRNNFALGQVHKALKEQHQKLKQQSFPQRQ
jgi:hypothetical protein